MLLAAGCNRAPAPVTVPGEPISKTSRPPTSLPKPSGKALTEMTWTTAEGRSSTLAAFAGKAVILDFWATYCPPCIEEIPHLNELQAKYGTADLQVIGLNSGGAEDRPKIAAFVKQNKISYPIAFPDDDLEAYIFSETDAIPQTAVFDRKGKLVSKIIGFDASAKRDLNSAVEAALAQGR